MLRAMPWCYGTENDGFKTCIEFQVVRLDVVFLAAEHELESGNGAVARDDVETGRGVELQIGQVVSYLLQ